jgi:hypothetical protein
MLLAKANISCHEEAVGRRERNLLQIATVSFLWPIGMLWPFYNFYSTLSRRQQWAQGNKTCCSKYTVSWLLAHWQALTI